MDRKSGINNRSVPLDIVADLNVNFAKETFTVKADGNEIFVITPSLRSAMMLLRALKHVGCSVDLLKAADRTLKRIDVTLFWQSSRFGILGSKSKPLLRSALLAFQSIVKTKVDGASP